MPQQSCSESFSDSTVVEEGKGLILAALGLRSSSSLKRSEDTERPENGSGILMGESLKWKPWGDSFPMLFVREYTFDGG